MTEQALVEQARLGDEEAFSRLIAAHQRMVYAIALRMTGNPEDAADLSQEAFLRAWKSLGGFQGESAFSTWLYRLTSNVCIDFIRKEKRRKAMDIASLDQEPEEGRRTELTDNRLLPEQELERSELREAIARNLEKLPEDYRRILTLRELGGLSYEEIARSLSLNEGTVKSRIARARLALRRLLLNDGNFSAAETSKELELSGTGGVPK
ncbi:MAG: polymerase subunit sigma [Oscillospiraceae bacterium]|nr:polymerase subunit sigma [Oscillospiraceae bacterium]